MILRIGRSDFLGLWVALLLVGILTVTKAQDASDSLLDTTLFDVGSESIQETKDQDTSSQEKKALPTSKSKKMSINPWMMTWRSVLADALKSDDKGKLNKLRAWFYCWSFLKNIYSLQFP